MGYWGALLYTALWETQYHWQRKPGESDRTPKDYNAFLRIGTNERVSLFCGKVDMDKDYYVISTDSCRGARCGYDSIDIIMGDTDVCPYDFGTVGSMAIRIHGVLVRNAACEAKGVLKELAGILKCPVDRLQTKDGVVFDKTSPIKR